MRTCTLACHMHDALTKAWPHTTIGFNSKCLHLSWAMLNACMTHSLLFGNMRARCEDNACFTMLACTLSLFTPHSRHCKLHLCYHLYAFLKAFRPFLMHCINFSCLMLISEFLGSEGFALCVRIKNELSLKSTLNLNFGRVMNN